MSTYLDRPLQLPDYQGTVPLDWLAKVGTIEQGEHDQNQAALQGQIDQLGQYPIVKPSDRAVITQKMSDIVGKMNEFSGQDLGDTRIYNKLMNYTSGMLNDSDIYTRIADNQRAVNARKDMEKMVKDDPSTYGANNAYIFNKAYGEWMNTPGKSFNAEYMPYQDDTEWKKGVIDDLYKNPDTFIKTLPNGSKVPYATEELKVVLPQKISAALAAAMPSNIGQQYRIDWEASKDRMTVPGALEDMNNHINDLLIKRSSVQDAMRHARTDDDRKAGQANIDRINDALNSLYTTRNTVASTDDPSQYYTFESHINSKFNNIGNAFAMEQHSNLKYDPYQLEMFKHNLDKDLESWKATLKAKANADATTPVTLINTLETLGYNQKAQTTPDEMTHIVGSGVKPGADGSFPLVLNNRPVMVDLQPLLKANGYDVDVRKAAGMSDLIDKYHQYIKGTSPASIFSPNVAVGTPTLPAPGSDTTANGGRWSPINMVPSRSDYTNGSVNVKPLKEFLKDQVTTNPKLVEYYKSNFGLDITNSKDLDIASSIANNADEMKAIENMTTQITGFGGVYKAYAGDGDNVIAGSKGEIVGNVLLEFPKSTMQHITDKGSMINSNFNHFLQKGIIKDTHKTTEDKKAEEIYQISVHVPANHDLGLAVSNYSSEHATKKEGIDVVGEQLGVWHQKASEINNAYPFIVNPDASVGAVKTHVLPLIKDPATKELASKALDAGADALKKNPPKDQKKIIIQGMIMLLRAKDEAEINKILSH